MPFTLKQLAEYVDAQVVGDACCTVDAFNALPDAGQGDITFINDNRYKGYLAKTKASAVILAKDNLPYCPTNALVTGDPYLAYAKTMRLLYEKKTTFFNPGIDRNASIGVQCSIGLTAYIGANAVIGDRVSIGDGCYIGPGCIIGDDVVVGNDSRFTASVTLCRDVKIGRAAFIHPGVVIGSDGFGMARDHKKSWLKIPQIGSVIVGNEVEIGANTTIDRGAIGNTVIEDGVKIDNQVQIGHNVRIGQDTAIAGCTGIAGSTVIGKRCMIGGAAAIIGHIQIVDDVVITGGSMVRNSIRAAGIYSSGLTASDHATWRKNTIRFKQLDAIARKLDQLSK